MLRVKFKKLALLLFLFSGLHCNQKTSKSNSTDFLEITLSENLPFKKVSLKKFDPVYGDYLPMKFQQKSIKNVFQFSFNLVDGSFIHLADENNIGVSNIFITPGDSVSLKLFWQSQSLMKDRVKGNFPGDNYVYQFIKDSVSSFYRKMESNQKIFENRESLSRFADTWFKKTIGQVLIQDPKMKISVPYNKFFLQPQLEMIKCRGKNLLLKKTQGRNRWNKFYADSNMANPNYQFWDFDYPEYWGFRDYLYEAINGSKAENLEKFIHNIFEFYKPGKDTTLLRISISQGLSVFSEKHTPGFTDFHTIKMVDSICKAYHLDNRKYNFLVSLPQLSFIIGHRVLENINLFPPGNPETNLANVINDTSSIYYIDYWASWCKPCIKGLPSTLKLYNEHISKLNVLFINIDEKREKFLWIVQKMKLPASHSYSIGMDDESQNNYKILNPKISIPAYQIVFYYKGEWRIMDAPPSDSPQLIDSLNELKLFLGRK